VIQSRKSFTESRLTYSLILWYLSANP